MFLWIHALGLRLGEYGLHMRSIATREINAVLDRRITIVQDDGDDCDNNRCIAVHDAVHLDRLDRHDKQRDRVISTSGSSRSHSRYCELLGSPYLSHQLQRIDFILLVKTALERYNCSKASGSDDTSRNSIIVNNRVRSMGCLPPTIATDVIPSLQNMCYSERVHDNDCIEQLQQQTLQDDHWLLQQETFSTVTIGRCTRRSSRSAGTGKAQEIEKYTRFPAMKKLLRYQEDNLMMNLLMRKLL